MKVMPSVLLPFGVAVVDDSQPAYSQIRMLDTSVMCVFGIVGYMLLRLLRLMVIHEWKSKVLPQAFKSHAPGLSAHHFGWRLVGLRPRCTTL